MKEEKLLEVLNVTKRFPGVIANDNISFDVYSGEVLGVIGENGAGKSTINNVINGIYPYGTYEGSIKINGSEVRSYSTYDSARMGIGFVPQETNILKYLSVTENIYVSDLKRDGKNSLFINFNRLHKKAQMLLDEYDIKLIPSQTAGRLSIGKQQLLMIARALADNPKILILDEPTTSLTIDDVQVLFNLIRKLKQQGVGIIFVSHRLDEVMEITDRVTVLRDGRNAGSFKREEYSRERIIESMVGRPIENMYPTRSVQIGEEVLRVENITVEHPYILNKNLINNVSFVLREGEVLGIAGLIGSGRTETLRAIYGSLKKTGDIFLSGQKRNINSERDAIEAGFSLVTEDRKMDGLLWQRNLEENILINNLKAISKMMHIRKKTAEQRAYKSFQQFGVKASGIHDMVTSLSGGNQQKIVMARAMNAEPKILLLDEPTKGIDVGAKNEIYNIINDLVQKGISIIFVSSELIELIAMCDRILVMSEGRIKGELSRGEATEKSIMMLAAQ